MSDVGSQFEKMVYSSTATRLWRWSGPYRALSLLPLPGPTKPPVPIVENLLTLARPTGSQPQAPDVALEIRTYLHFVEAQARKQGVRIDVAIEPGLPRLYCDGGELRQLLLNLVVNAMEAMPDGGQLGVRAGQGTASGTVRLEVEDQGSGIAPEHKALIFKPFYTTKASGTGLGWPFVIRLPDAIMVRSGWKTPLPEVRLLR